MSQTIFRRIVMLTSTTALAAGGALIPASAFAAPAHSGVVAMAPTHGHHGHHGDGGGGGGGPVNNNVPVINNNTGGGSPVNNNVPIINNN